MRALIGVELLRKLPAGPEDIRDTKLPGFVLRVRPSGVHTYFANPRGEWIKLGTTATLTAPEARERARQELGKTTEQRRRERQEAEQAADEAERAAMEARRDAYTLRQFIADHYEPWVKVNRKTGAEQTARLRQTFAELLDKPLARLSAFDIERWRSARLKAGKSAETVNRDLNTLRGALSRALDWSADLGLGLTVHPLAKVKAVKTDTRAQVRYLSTAEESRLLKALTARDEARRAERERANRWRTERKYAAWPVYGTYTDHLTPMVTLALHTGMRRGELFALTWADVNPTKAVVTVRGETAKSDQTRHIPLNVTAATVLATWREITKPEKVTDLVFPGADGARLEDIKTAWGALLKAAKIEAFRFHDCRHHFASKLVMAGVDLNTVRELLGHSDLKMTLRYAHLAPEHRAAAVAKLVGA
ncbi:MAG TPA: site-specific integrase [Vicinamibacterales bacterium]